MEQKLANMKLLQQALLLAEADDQSTLPENTIKDIQSNIRKGAQDTTQEWANALELVHKAYSVSQVERPTPNMVGAWKQYEENIQYAVSQLSKARGIDGNWRMSSASLHEAMEGRQFKVFLDIPNTEKTIEAVVEGPDINSIIDMMRTHIKKQVPNYDIKIEEEGNSATITFWQHGIRTNAIVKISPK
jgi:hypothetical protein